MSFDVLTNRNAFFSQMEKEVAKLLDPATGAPRAELVERVSCPACDLAGRSFLSKWGFEYERCDGCGLIFVNPRLRESVVIEAYKHGSKANEMWAKDVHSSSVQLSVNQEYFAGQLNLLEKFTSSGSVLDVGCGNGDFLSLAVQRGFDVAGLELGEDAVAIARRKGVRIFEALLGDPALEGLRYDVVTMFGVLEHLYHPVRDLSYVFGMLKSGGLLMGVTPNAFSLVGMLLHRDARFYTPRNHPIIFSFSSLEKMLRRVGFEILQMDTVLSGYDSIVNYLQYREPFGPTAFDDLPPRLRSVVEDRAAFERVLHDYDLGLRLRVVARKP